MTSSATPAHFKPRAQPAYDGLAVIYDLSDFTHFFTQPDAHRYVPRFLNRMAEAISIIVHGGNQYWLDSPEAAEPIRLPLVHRKFLGDGELLLFRIGEDDTDVPFLINRLWNIQNSYSKILKAAQADIPVAIMPPSIKFGIARGDLYELKRVDPQDPSEFIGVSINLASRLVKYCPELSFVASSRIELTELALKAYRYMPVVATSVRGFPDEIVIVDSGEFEKLSEELCTRLFRKLE
jgi:hypothetical protein